MEQDTQAGSKVMPSSFRPGTQKVSVKLVMEKTAGSTVQFTHDEGVVKKLITSVAGSTFTEQEMRSHNPVEADEWEDMVGRMTSGLMAKKLAISLSREQHSVWSGALSTLAKLDISGPTDLVKVVDGFGCIQDKEVEGTLIGQPFWATTYAGRALAPIDVAGFHVDRETSWFINTNNPSGLDVFMDFARGEINAWAVASGIQNFDFNGNNVRMTVPVATSGFATYAQFVGNVPRDIRITRVMHAAVIVEGMIALGGGVTPANRAALGLQNVCLIDWRRDDFTAFLRTYVSTVQNRLQGMLGAMMGWGEVRALRMTGSTWQLLKEAGIGLSTAPYRVTGTDLEYGWMMSGDVSYVVSDDQYILVTDRGASSRLKDAAWAMVKRRI